MRSRDVLALAADFDRTLTDPELRLVPAAVRELRRAREAGKRVIVVSGRGAEFLQAMLGASADAIVAENGAILVQGARVRALGPPLHDVAHALEALGIELERGEHLISADVEHEDRIRDALARHPVALIRNRDRVMVLPRGVDKAAGLLAALRALEIPPERCAAVGDGENDIAMLRAVGVRLAVGNAVPELREVAHEVLPGFGGEAVARWIREAWIPEALA